MPSSSQRLCTASEAIHALQFALCQSSHISKHGLDTAHFNPARSAVSSASRNPNRVCWVSLASTSNTHQISSNGSAFLAAPPSLLASFTMPTGSVYRCSMRTSTLFIWRDRFIASRYSRSVTSPSTTIRKRFSCLRFRAGLLARSFLATITPRSRIPEKFALVHLG